MHRPQVATTYSPELRGESPTRSSTSSSSYRPTLSQKAKRHVVTITDALRSSGPPMGTAVAPPSLESPNKWVVAGGEADGSGMPSAQSPPPPSVHREHVVDAAWSGGILRAQSAHLVEVLNEDCLSEVPSGVASPLPMRATPYVASSIFDLRRAAPVVNGFDRLDHSIMHLVHRLPESTLEDKFQTISKWLDSYHVDVVPRKLAAQLALLLGLGGEPSMQSGVAPQEGGLHKAPTGKSSSLQRALVATSSSMTGSDPSFGGATQGAAASNVSLKSIISAAFSLHQLMLVLIKQKPILGPVAMKTLERIYEAIFVQENPLATMPQELMEFTASREALKRSLRHFQHRTFFQEARDAVRRMAAVQEFTAKYEAVKLRQMSSVVKQITGRSTMWLSTCFQLWRGEVAHSKGERKRQDAFLSMQAERDQIRTRVEGLENTVAQKNLKISELEEALKVQLNRAEIAKSAFKYDLLMVSEDAQRAKDALKERTEQLAATNAKCARLLDTLQRNRSALDAQLHALDAVLWDATSWSRAADAWRNVNGPLSEENSCKWLRAVACKALQDYRSEWETGPIPTEATEAAADAGAGEGADGGPTTGSEHGGGDGEAQPEATAPLSDLEVLCSAYISERSSTTVRSGHEAINLVALALLHLHGSPPLPPSPEPQGSAPKVTWTAVRSAFLDCPYLMQKIRTLMDWCQQTLHVPLGPMLHEFLLEDASSSAPVHAMVLRLLQVSLSPLGRLSLHNDNRWAANVMERLRAAPSTSPVDCDDGGATMLDCDSDGGGDGGMLRALQVPNPLQPLHERLEALLQLSPVSSACDALLLSSVSPKMPWAPMSVALRQLTVAESADRTGFQLSAKDLSMLPASIGCSDEAALQAIQAELKLHFLFLRQAFLSYAGFESGSAVSATLSDYGLSKMMRDCRIGKPGVVDTATVKGLAGDGLSAKRFAVALVHIAGLRFSDRSVPDALVALITRMRMSLSTQAAELLLLNPLRGDATFCGMMEDIRPELMKVFRRYATESAGGNRITSSEVAKMLHELKLSDEQLTGAEMQEAFAIMGPVQGALVFDQFVSFLWLLGSIRVRAPWQTRTARVARFLFDMILTPLQKKLQIQTVSL